MNTNRESYIATPEVLSWETYSQTPEVFVCERVSDQINPRIILGTTALLVFIAVLFNQPLIFVAIGINSITLIWWYGGTKQVLQSGNILDTIIWLLVTIIAGMFAATMLNQPMILAAMAAKAFLLAAWVCVCKKVFQSTNIMDKSIMIVVVYCIALMPAVAFNQLWMFALANVDLIYFTIWNCFDNTREQCYTQAIPVLSEESPLVANTPFGRSAPIAIPYARYTDI